VRVALPPEHLAFQLGEAMQARRGGAPAAAAPACVRARVHRR